MEFTRETKEKFLELFGRHEIVTVSRKYGSTPSSWENKFIGVRDGLKWDFTPLVIHLSGCKADADGLGARGFATGILHRALRSLADEGFKFPSDYVNSTSDFCQTFYF